MGSPFSPRVALLLLCSVLSICVNTALSQVLDVDALFQVDFTTDDDGGCQTIGRARIQRMLEDAGDYAQAGVNLMSDFDSVPEARRLLVNYIRGIGGARFGNRRNSIRDRYQGVLDFLTNNQGGPAGGKPFLFCSDTWLLEQTMNDQARDNQGNEIFTKDTPPKPVLIRDIPEYVQKQGPKLDQVPYWSEKHKAYFFDEIYPNGGYCGSPQSHGLTTWQHPPSSLMICPGVFQTRGSVRNVVLNPQPSINGQRPSKIPVGSQAIGDLLPDSATLFHEVFHLLGEWDTVPDGGEVYSIGNMHSMTLSEAVKNPETYTAMAVGYWLTMRDPPVLGNRIEFYAYYPTRG